MKHYKTLTAVVKVRRLTAVILVGKVGKLIVSDVTISFGEDHDRWKLGTAQLGGRWELDQAINEFLEDPARFKYFGPRVPTVQTEIQIHLGPVPVAMTLVEIDLNYTAEQALDFFQEAPNAFYRGLGYSLAERLGLLRQAA